jgi:DNA mismatch repair protein MutS2
MDEHTLRVLEFDKVLAKLARHTSFSAGNELALALRPSTERDEVVRRQRVTAEAIRLRGAQPRVGLGGVRDVRSMADKASRGGVLLPSELLDVSSTLSAAGQQRTMVTRFADEAPLLAELVRQFEPLPDLVQEIERSIDQRGEIADAASPQLGALRRNVRVAHDRLQEKLQAILRSSQYKDAIQEPLVTQRDGRYVIPVKADQRGTLRGIVHDVSSSGATVFVEPLSVVDLGNSWRELQLEEEREVQRILRELSGLVGDSAPEIIDTVAALAELDVALAKAHLADELDARELPHAGAEQAWIGDSGDPLYLLNGRHPLLKGDVVPSTIDVGANYRALLITGPNTGGKTVALKTAGLLTLMAQAGLPVPADQASKVPVFDSVDADIGDEQSIEQSLSTFSSHMRHIIEILASATPHSLVLLDELAAGTDPIEGSALARAILSRLLEIGCCVIATTHHGELKAFAHTTPGMRNASVDFDMETLRPTYHLTIGLPGGSNALTIAERLGLPHDIIESARGFVAPDQARVETLLSDIRRERDEAVAARMAGEQARGEAEEARSEAEQRLAEVEEHLDQMITRTTIEIERDAEQVRKLIVQAETAVERGRLKQAAERLQKALETRGKVEERRPPKRVKPATPKRVPAHEGPSPSEIEPGDLVWIAGYDRFGEALSAPDERGEVEVHLGPLRGRVKLTQVERVQRPRHHEGQGSGVKGQGSTTPPVIDASPVDVPLPEIEVRGQTVDEALPAVDQYLDRAYRASLPWVRIIHGRGTGTLRRQVREMLHKHPLVRSYETGKPEEGGDGVTVAHLAE